MEKYGVDRVETFIDTILSFENLIDMLELVKPDATLSHRKKMNLLKMTVHNP